MHERTPAFYYAGDLVTAIRSQGRREEAALIARELVSAYPYNLTALRELGRRCVARAWSLRGGDG